MNKKASLILVQNTCLKKTAEKKNQTLKLPRYNQVELLVNKFLTSVQPRHGPKA